jgi:peptidoglycan hydrolase-like protein with peptidoglycan-binding domain
MNHLFEEDKMHITDILTMAEEQEIRHLNIPDAVIIWSGPYTFTEAAKSSGGGLYVITQKSGKPLYVGQSSNFKSRFSRRLHVLRIAACDLTQRGVYLGRIVKPASRSVTKNLRLDLESVLIRSYLRRGHRLVNRNSIREFKMGPRDATIRNDGTLPPQMMRQILIKGNSRFELHPVDDLDELLEYESDGISDFVMVDFDDEISRRHPQRLKGPIGKILHPRPKPITDRPRPRRRIRRPRRRLPLFRRAHSQLHSNVPYLSSSEGTEYIRWIQSSLNRIMRIRLSVNGVMNRATRDALRAFQKREGLLADGIAGPETKKVLLDLRPKELRQRSSEPERLSAFNLNKF